jgi:hypothetical protein
MSVGERAHHSGSGMLDMNTHAESMLQESKDSFNCRHVVHSQRMEVLTYFIDGKGYVRPCEGKILKGLDKATRGRVNMSQLKLSLSTLSIS